MMNKEVVITFNTGRKVLLFSIGLVFFALGLFFSLKADVLVPFWIIKNPWVVRIAGLASIVYFGIALVLYSRILFRKTALIINEDGIVDSSSAGGEAGFVSWSEISGIEQYESNGATVIKVFLVKPESFLERVNSRVIKYSLRKNYRTYRTPFVIPMVALNSYVDTLEKVLKSYFEEYNRRNSIR